MLLTNDRIATYRKFSYLHSRVLLELQDDIASLEREIDELDAIDNETVAGQKRLCNRQFDLKRSRGEDDFRPRGEVLSEIHSKLSVLHIINMEEQLK